MKISAVQHKVDGNGVPTRQTITIEIEPGDDRIGDINGLIIRDRLDAFLRIYGRGQYAEVHDDDDLHHLLVAGGYIEHMWNGRMAALLWAARDTWGWSWRRIATAYDGDHNTVKRRIQKVRATYAESGFWRDRDGLHSGTPEEARARALNNQANDE